MSNWSSWKKSLTDAVSTAAVAASAAVTKAAEVAKDVADDSYAIAIGAKCLRDYRMLHQISTGGPQSIWKVYSATNRNQGAVYPEVAVWILDKKALMDQHKTLKPKAFEPFFNQQKKDCSQLKVLRHPGILRLIEPLEETRNQLVFVTEPLLGSLSCILTHFAGIPTAPTSSRDLTLSPLEAKLGLLHLAETLHFLHHEAKLAHCAVSPESIYLTADGGWKLSTFAHAVPADYASPNAGVEGFDYTLSSGPCDEMMKPPIGYMAPELVGGMDHKGGVTPAVDIFSLGAVAYELVVGRPVLPARSVQEYRQRVGSLAAVMDMPSVPPSFQATLRSMLSTAPTGRPTASVFTTAPFFLEDVPLRALRFLDSILQREPSQKAAFLRDLGTLWPQLDDRLLRHKVLPPLLQELKSDATQLAAFPVVLAIAQKQGRDEFMKSTLPQLKPIFLTANGEMLLLLVRNSHTFASLMSTEAVGECLLPMFERAVEGNNSRLQEEVLRNLAKMADALPYPILKEMMPKVTAICLRTTSAGVRASSCALMARLVPRLNREDSDQMLDIITQVTAVDHTPGTLMATSAVCDEISKQHGAVTTATRIIPLLAPNLMAASLTGPQLSQICTILKSMIDRVEAKRLPELERKARIPPGGAPPSTTTNDPKDSWDTPLGPPPAQVSTSASTSSLGSLSGPTTPSAVPAAAPPAASWSLDPLPTPSQPPAPVPAPLPTNPNPPDPAWDWISPANASPPRYTPSAAPSQPRPQKPSTMRPMSTPSTIPPAVPPPSISNNQPLPDDLFGGLSVSPSTTPSAPPSWNPSPLSGPPATSTSSLSSLGGPPMGGLSMGGMAGPSMGGGGTSFGGPSMGGPSMGGGMRPMKPPGMGAGSGLSTSTSGDMFGGLSVGGGPSMGGGGGGGGADPFGSLLSGGGAPGGPAMSSQPLGGMPSNDPFSALAAGNTGRPPVQSQMNMGGMGGGMGGGMRPMGIRPPPPARPPPSDGSLI